MRSVNIHEAKTQLSRLIEQAAAGEPFIIAKAGKPLVQVSAIPRAIDHPPSRLGFMAGEITAPDDFNALGRDQIAAMFNGST